MGAALQLLIILLAVQGHKFLWEHKQLHGTMAPVKSVIVITTYSRLHLVPGIPQDNFIKNEKMKKTYKRILIGLVILAISHTFTANGQAIKTSEYNRIDSAQKIMMRDSLQISDSLITKIFALRDNYFQKVNQVRLNNQLSEQQQNNEAQIIRKQNIESIKDLLGSDVYVKYVQLIKNRMQKSNVTGNVLTNDGGN